MNAKYLGYEFLRLWRNKAFFFFTLIFPLILFIIFAEMMGSSMVSLGAGDVSLVLYYMVSMAGYGGLMAALSGGARIATERAVGWNRQLRLSPLSTTMYMFSKAATTYLMCFLSMALIISAGLILGARVEGAHRWFIMLGLTVVALVPFVVIGIVFGQLLAPDAMGPLLGGGGAFFAYLGGMWFPFSPGSTMDQVGQMFPSYWISQASLTAIEGGTWPLKAWLVVGAWSVVFLAAAVWAYQRDLTRR
jgi:ABC-2 type transport system permease protein